MILIKKKERRIADFGFQVGFECWSVGYLFASFRKAVSLRESPFSLAPLQGKSLK